MATGTDYERFHAVCTEFEEVRVTLRALDWPVAGLSLMGDDWMQG